MSPVAGSAGPGAQQGLGMLSSTHLLRTPSLIGSRLVLQTLKALVGHQVNLNLNYQRICLCAELEGGLEAVWLLMPSSLQLQGSELPVPFLAEHPPRV